MLFRPQKELSDGSENFQYFNSCSVFLALFLQAAKVIHLLAWEKPHCLRDGWLKEDKTFCGFFQRGVDFISAQKPIISGNILFCKRTAFCCFCIPPNPMVFCFPLVYLLRRQCQSLRFFYIFCPTLKIAHFCAICDFFKTLQNLQPPSRDPRGYFSWVVLTRKIFIPPLHSKNSLPPPEKKNSATHS